MSETPMAIEATTEPFDTTTCDAQCMRHDTVCEGIIWRALVHSQSCRDRRGALGAPTARALPAAPSPVAPEVATLERLAKAALAAGYTVSPIKGFEDDPQIAYMMASTPTPILALLAHVARLSEEVAFMEKQEDELRTQLAALRGSIQGGAA